MLHRGTGWTFDYLSIIIVIVLMLGPNLAPPSRRW